jgi:Mrp family chromosome partitioning ATPase/capsular polysaccharide biosynthesis protein
MEPVNSTQPRLADYTGPLLTRKWLILIAVVLATGGVYAYYAHKPNVYTASTLVYVIDPGDPVTGQQNQQATDRQVEDQASLLDSRSTAGLVARQIGYSGTTTDLLERVSITSRPGEDFVQVTANGRSTQEAAAIANGFGEEFVALVNGAWKTRIANALRLSEAQFAALGSGATADLGRADLTTQIDRLKLALQDPVTISKMVQSALPPSGPSSPKPVRDALFALVVSLVLAVGLAYGIERFDRRLKNPDEMEGAYGTPLLSVVPHTAKPSAAKGDTAVISSDFREPFRVLRTNVELAALDAPPRTIVVTSAMPGEGKSTVVRNLALAIRESGKRVAVVDLDLRHPSLAAMFAVAPGPGLTDVLRGEAECADVQIDISVAFAAIDELLRVGKATASRYESNGRVGRNASAQAGSGLTLVLSGPRPANPPAVLASDRLAEVLNELRDHHDVVLIDSAPLLAVADTVPLIRYADATLLVGRLGVTTRDTAKRVMEFVSRVPDMNLLGVVANDLTRVEAEAYGYGYGAAYGNEREPAEEAAAPRPKQTV